MVMRGKSDKAWAEREAALQVEGQRRRPRGVVSAEILGMLRGIYSLTEAWMNWWRPEHHCHLCARERAAAQQTAAAKPPRPAAPRNEG